MPALSCFQDNCPVLCCSNSRRTLLALGSPGERGGTPGCPQTRLLQVLVKPPRRLEGGGDSTHPVHSRTLEAPPG